MNVYLRLRPDSEGSALDISETSVTFRSHASVGGSHGVDPHERTFSLDKVFPPSASQADVTAVLLGPIVDNLAHGVNVQMASLGDSQTGKTHTMLGQQGVSQGLLQRILTKVFQLMNENEGVTVQYSLSAVELVNDKVYDLLNKRSPLGQNKNHLKGFKAVPLTTLAQALQYIRDTLCTNINGHISVKFNIRQINLARSTITESSLILTDTKGSQYKRDLQDFEKLLQGNSEPHSALMKLLYKPMFGNYTRFIVMHDSFLPVNQAQTLNTLKFSAHCTGFQPRIIVHSNVYPIDVQREYDLFKETSDIKNKNMRLQLDYATKCLEHEPSTKFDETDVKNLANENLSLTMKVETYLTELGEFNTVLNSLLNKIELHSSLRGQHNDKNKKKKEKLVSRSDMLTRKCQKTEQTGSELMEYINKKDVELQRLLTDNNNLKQNVHSIKDTYGEQQERIEHLENSISFSSSHISRFSVSSFATSINSAASNSTGSTNRTFATSNKSPGRKKSQDTTNAGGFNLQILKSK
ncbi:uncharacterized protein KNAG_0M02540 [Huiozyma naganishii CBS 8797]|uniref:Kinesin motor domain-containing protein n=1 Tax=Huiozyma naganishii (strain ATCC MYA-139 / BCRC 22969 / CBS 8797 / KCTC 17520 / NBRC 10181 / NCYC 3082 / Yp74L-3) TaxID=1071383 RepID=J7S4B3_HUIN7|nr:hypothetical protein KNAG_0M02540 [Kazachstania naganishii CBS 8797]CCK73107.1 hypothetical protein KNAG_0M02540 [Kazachstania naganishii CBS 8797]